MLSPVVSPAAPALADAHAPAAARSQAAIARPGEPAERTREAVLLALLLAIRQADPAVPTLVRAELDIDKATKRVVARVVSAIDGKVVRQYPPEETLRLLARAREEFGRLVKAQV